MDQLVNAVMEKTGLPREQAQQAVTTVLAFLKERLPGPMAAQIDTVLGAGQMGDVAKGLGGLLGR